MKEVVDSGLTSDMITRFENAFAKEMGLDYPLLADFHPKGEVASKYGVYLEAKGITGRVNIIINKEGKIAAVQENDIPNVPEMEPLHKTLAELS